MGNSRSRYLNAIIDAALFFLFFGFLIAVYFIDGGKHFESVVGLFLIFFGCIMILFLLVVRRAHYIFFGVWFVLAGLVDFIVMSKQIPYSSSELWPFVGISFVIALLVSCYYKYHRLKMKYIIPSAIIFILSLILMLFSFRMISVSFKQVVLFLIPVCWVVVICWYFLQKLINFHKSTDNIEHGEIK